MALPYPEGQVYFRRTALKLLDAGYNFDAENDKSFYSHCLLENVWNTWAFSSNTNPDINHVPYHPRATAKKGFADSYGTYFGALIANEKQIDSVELTIDLLRRLGQDDHHV